MIDNIKTAVKGKSKKQIIKLMQDMTDEEILCLLYDWGFWSRDKQKAPLGDWVTWLILAGRGFGKTRTGSEWIREKVESGEARRIALVAPTSADARDVMVEGESGILNIFPPNRMPVYEPSKRRITFHTGAIATTFSADEPERLRGPQHDTAWCDELCLSPDTMILTDRGEVPIKDIKLGDKVVTRNGLRKVTNCGITQKNAQLYEVVLSNGRSLKGTANHPVYVGNLGKFIPLIDLRAFDTMKLSDTYDRSDISWKKNQRELDGMENIGTQLMEDISKIDMECYCIEKFGKNIMVEYLEDMLYIIKMKIKQIMNYIISNVLKRVNMENYIANTSLVGVNQRKDERKIAKHQNCNGKIKNLLKENACTVEENLNLRGREQNIVVTHVKTKIEEKVELIMKHVNVLYVEKNFKPINIERKKHVVVRVLGVYPVKKKSDVYNIEVEGEHEYFANGILVHNCSWRYPTAYDMLQFGLRLGNPQCVITTTPKPTKIIKEILKNESTTLTTGTTYENRENLAKSFFKQVISKYEGTRLGRQELNAEILEDTPGALWTRNILENYRVSELPDLIRIVVGIDPAVTANKSSNETGIIVAGLGRNGHGYILDDFSLKAPPARWASRAVEGFEKWKADKIVAEVNNGGDLVSFTIATVDKTVPVKKVHASRGKKARAEPISALYEQGKVHHLGCLTQLEDQLTSWVPGEGESPDRIDALVWSLWELMVDGIKTHKKVKPSGITSTSSWNL